MQKHDPNNEAPRNTLVGRTPVAGCRLCHPGTSQCAKVSQWLRARVPSNRLHDSKKISEGQAFTPSGVVQRSAGKKGARAQLEHMNAQLI
jgi:hypothetical protein